MNLRWSGGTSRSSQKTPSSQVAITSSTKKWTRFTSWYIVITLIRIITKWRERTYRMISEGSCDTEDWSNDAENSDLQQE